MPQATPTHTTTPASGPRGPKPNWQLLQEARDALLMEADAELIRLCDRFAEIELKGRAQFVEIKDDDERDLAWEPLSAERKKIRRRLNALPWPSTPAGARAMARAAIAAAPVDVHGNAFFSGADAEWLGLGATEFLAGENGVLVPVELAMLRQLPAMRAGGAITWMAVAMSVHAGGVSPDAAYAGWIEQMTGEAPQRGK